MGAGRGRTGVNLATGVSVVGYKHVARRAHDRKLAACRVGPLCPTGTGYYTRDHVPARGGTLLLNAGVPFQDAREARSLNEARGMRSKTPTVCDAP